MIRLFIISDIHFINSLIINKAPMLPATTATTQNALSSPTPVEVGMI